MMTRTRNKTRCYRLYGMLLFQVHPFPEEDSWIDFGFHVC